MIIKTRPLLLALILLVVIPLFADAQDKQPPASPQSSTTESPSPQVSVEQSAVVKPATLTYQNREIVTLRAMLLGATPEQRVLASSERLDDMTDLALRGEIKIVPVNDGFFLVVGTSLVVAVFPQDVDPASGKSLRQVTEEAAANLKAALLAHQEQRKVPVILRGIGLSLLGTVIFVVLAVLLWRLRAYLLNRFSRHAASKKERYRVFGLEFQNIALALLQTISRLLTLSLFVLLAYQWITFVLRRFPYTYPWGQAMRGFLWGKIGFLAQKAMEAVPDLVTVLIIFFLARLITQAIKQFFDGIEAGRFPVPGLYAETAGATRRLVNTLIWLFTLVVAYPYLPGSQSAAFKGVSVFVGLVFTLGSSGVVNHLMSGLVLVYSRAFKKGDIIRIGDQEGMVMEVGPLSVKIATKKREELTIPNTVMTSSIVTNYSRISKEEGLILTTTVTIGYDAPWRQVHEMLKLAASKTSGLRETPAPFVLQTSLSDFYVEYRLCVSPKDPDERIRILSQLHENIQDAFNEYGVQILSPHFESQPPGTIFVPKEKWFSAPAKEPPKEKKE